MLLPHFSLMEANCCPHMKIEKKKKNHKPRKTPVSPETQTMAMEPIKHLHLVILGWIREFQFFFFLINLYNPILSLYKYFLNIYTY